MEYMEPCAANLVALLAGVAVVSIYVIFFE